MTLRPCGCRVQRVVARKGGREVDDEEILRKSLLISDAFDEL